MHIFVFIDSGSEKIRVQKKKRCSLVFYFFNLDSKLPLTDCRFGCSFCIAFLSCSFSLCIYLQKIEPGTSLTLGPHQLMQKQLSFHPLHDNISK